MRYTDLAAAERNLQRYLPVGSAVVKSSWRTQSQDDVSLVTPTLVDAAAHVCGSRKRYRMRLLWGKTKSSWIGEIHLQFKLWGCQWYRIARGIFFNWLNLVNKLFFNAELLRSQPIICSALWIKLVLQSMIQSICILSMKFQEVRSMIEKRFWAMALWKS